MHKPCSATRRRKKHQKIDTPDSSEDDAVHRKPLQYMEFNDNSEMPSSSLTSKGDDCKSQVLVSTLSSPITKLKPSTQNPTVTVSNKFYSNLPILHPNSTNKDLYEEHYLADLGYSSKNAANWDKIVQPRKSDLDKLLMKMIENFEKTNVQIKISDTTFNCHMLVLQCYSDFFLELSNEQIVILPSEKVSVQAFMMIYEWMLSPKPIVQREGLLELFIAAQFLKIKELVDQCWACIDDHEQFCEDAAFMLYLEARQFGYDLIQQLMVGRICRFFLSVVASKDFLELSKKEVCSLLQSNAIGINSESEVLMAGIRWLQYDWDERKDYMLDLIACVRFCLMTHCQLVKIKNSKSPFIEQIIECPDVRQTIDDALSYLNAKYWCSDDPEGIINLMEGLNITEPLERQWIRDERWTFCPNEMHTCYESFLEYLQWIKSIGKEHWEGLQCYKENPNFSSPPYRLIPTNGANETMQNSPKTIPIRKSEKSYDLTDIHPKPEASIRKSKRLASDPNRALPPMVTLMDSKNFKKPKRSQPKRSSSTKTRTEKQWIEEDIPLRVIKTEPNARVKLSRSVSNNSLTPEKDVVSEVYFNVNNVEIIPIRDVYNNILPKAALTPIVLTETKKVQSSITELQVSLPVSARRKLPISELKFNTSLGDTTLVPPVPNTMSDMSLYAFDHETILVFGGIDPSDGQHFDDNGRMVWHYKPQVNRWDAVSRMPKGRYQHAAVYFQGRIFITGGIQINGHKPTTTKSMWSFDPSTRSWFAEKDMPFARSNHGAVVAHIQIYVVGGEDSNHNPIKSVLCYDPVSTIWSKMASMQIERSGAAIATHKGLIWAAGGRILNDDQSICRSVECYDPITNQWTMSNSLRMPRCFGKLCSVDGYLYIVGGINHRNKLSIGSIDFYDNKHKIWKLLDELEVPRHNHEAVAIESQILIIGGETKSERIEKSVGNVECFCTDRLAWIDGIESIPELITGMTAVVLPRDSTL